MLLNFRIPEELMVSIAKKCYTYSEKLDELTKEPQVSNWNCTLQMRDHMVYLYSWLWSNFENTVFMIRTSKDFVTYNDKVWWTKWFPIHSEGKSFWLLTLRTEPYLRKSISRRKQLNRQVSERKKRIGLNPRKSDCHL